MQKNCKKYMNSRFNPFNHDRENDHEQDKSSEQNVDRYTDFSPDASDRIGTRRDNTDNIATEDPEDKAQPRRKGRFSRAFYMLMLKLGLVGAAILGVLFIYFDSVVFSKFEVDDRWVLPAVVYSRPLELYPDQKLSLSQMIYELKLLKYRQVQKL